MDEVEILDMEQEGEVVNPQEDDAEGAQGQEPEGEQGTEAAEPSGKPKQSHEDNRRYQAARRSGEQAGYDRAMREINERIARSGMRSPATGENIRDIEGLESYGKAFRQQRIRERAQKEGRTEAEVEEEEANREFISESRRRAEEDRKKKSEQEFARKDAADFAEQFPDVDLQKTLENKAFLRFCGSRFGKEPLAALYGDFLDLTGAAQKVAAARVESKKERATGSGGGSGAESLTARQQKELDEWNRNYPQMKMTAKEFLSRG